MNPLAQELNEQLSSCVAGRLLSAMGQRMYFPKGILSQGAEADKFATRYNATIGMAYEHGQPMMLDALKKALPTLTPREAVAYASTGGVQALRERWKVAMEAKNPSLRGASFSLPVVVPGLTAAVSGLCDLFLDKGDSVVIPDLFWPNYKLIVEERKEARGITFPFFKDGGFNLEGFEAALREAAAPKSKAVCILNFPNNPAGYTPTLAEAEKIVAALVRLADSGVDVLVISDDAYFGLQYEEGLLRESIFARLVKAHDRILTAKADGPTKEDYVWGFRIGFVSFAGKAIGAAQQEALVKKAMGVLRSTVSNSSSLGQNLLLKAMNEAGYEAQKAHYRAVLEARFTMFKKALMESALPAGFAPLPFNSGYFMSFICTGFSAEALRLALLAEGVGVISIQDKYLRVAFSCVEEGDIPDLVARIAAQARLLAP